MRLNFNGIFMLLRFVLQNFGSFKDEVEFNTFPSSKSQSHENHKIVCNFATSLRLSAIYGANSAGKSTLIKGIRLIKTLMSVGNIKTLNIHEDMSFKFDKKCLHEPSALAIEFYQNGNIYYYHIEFEKQEICYEELLLSKKTTDTLIFKRTKDDIEINDSFGKQPITKDFTNALKRLVRPEMLLLYFLGELYPNEIEKVTDAYHWFTNNLDIVLPNAKTGVVAHYLDIDSDFRNMVNLVMPQLKTGITKLDVRKETIQEHDAKSDSKLMQLIQKAKETPNMPKVLVTDDGDISNIVFENNSIVKKTLVPIHKRFDGQEEELPLQLESDGTRRLIEYMPLFYAITHKNKVYVVDEIERSMHPILIKELVREISNSDKAQGQLIFTTHEAELLDQQIFRPDEIWFAQKDIEQATKLYSLSDYNIHKTANIENGYLNGRYGGIPFLSNLKDLHW